MPRLEQEAAERMGPSLKILQRSNSERNLRGQIDEVGLVRQGDVVDVQQVYVNMRLYSITYS